MGTESLSTKRHLTMPTIPRILATTALCLAALGLSSCYSSLHKYVWNRAEIIDEAYWEAQCDACPPLRLGKKEGL